MAHFPDQWPHVTGFNSQWREIWRCFQPWCIRATEREPNTSKCGKSTGPDIKLSLMQMNCLGMEQMVFFCSTVQVNARPSCPFICTCKYWKQWLLFHLHTWIMIMKSWQVLFCNLLFKCATCPCWDTFFFPAVCCQILLKVPSGQSPWFVWDNNWDLDGVIGGHDKQEATSF